MRPNKRRESFKRSKFYLTPDPQKIEDMPQNCYTKKVVKVQVTKVTEVMTETTTMMEMGNMMEMSSD